MTETNRARRRRIKKVKRRRRIAFLLVPFLVLVSAVSIYGFFLYNKASEAAGSSFEDDGREKSELRESGVDPSVDNVSVLFIGVDGSAKRTSQGKGDPRSDALILATFNKEAKSVKLLSIPRDSYVYIPEVGYKTKINHAHAYGGPKASIEAVEGLMDLPVDYFVRLNFDAFVDVVDAIGGITAEVPYEFSESNSKDEKNTIHLMPGEQLLNGEEALALARTRKLDNDIARGERQQEIIKAIMDKALSANALLKYGDVIEAVGSNVSTNMTFDQMKSFVSYGATGNLNVETDTLKGHDLWTDAYYYEVDKAHLAEKKAELRKHLELPPPADGAATAVQ